MSKKDLIITSLDRFGWNELNNWAKSIRSTGFSGDLAAVVYRVNDQNLILKANEFGINLISAEISDRGTEINHNEQPRHGTMVNRNRFFHMWWYLQDKTETYRWVISTDARDVFFQSNPSEFLDKLIVSDNIHILASSEGQIYEKEPWNAEDQTNAFGPVTWELLMKNEAVKNAGVMTVSGKMAANIFLNIFFTSKHYNDAAADQAAYNLLTASSLKHVTKVLTHDDGWACQCGTILDTNKPYHRDTFIESIPSYSNGKFFTIDGREFVVVHQYDRVAGCKEIIDRKYS